MKKIYKSLLLIFIFTNIQFSCDNTFTLNVDCEECYQKKPKDGDLEIKVSINSENQRIPIKVFENNIENPHPYHTDTIDTETYYLTNVSLNKTYAVQATYKKGDKTIIAVDGGKFKTKLVSDYCDVECYIIEGADYDVRLK